MVLVLEEVVFSKLLIVLLFSKGFHVVLVFFASFCLLHGLFDYVAVFFESLL